MKLFDRSNKQKSLADFKASAACIDKDEAINAITGGTLSGCHTGGIKIASLGSMSGLSSISAFSAGSLRV